MHKRAARYFRPDLFRDPQSVIFVSGILGVFLGCLGAGWFPPPVLRRCLDAAMASTAGPVNLILCGLIPLLSGAAFLSAGWSLGSLLAAPALATAGCSFCLCAVFSAFGTAGAVPGALLLVGRAGAMLFLVWFLLNARDSRHLTRPLAIAAFGTAAGILLSYLLTEPFLQELYQSVFISL